MITISSAFLSVMCTLSLHDALPICLSAHYNFNNEKSRISLRQILGELLLTAGAVLLLFEIYEAYWAKVESGKLQEQRSEEHTSELQSRGHLVCSLLLEKTIRNRKAN